MRGKQARYCAACDQNSRYISPVRLYLVVSVIFIFLLSVTSSREVVIAANVDGEFELLPFFAQSFARILRRVWICGSEDSMLLAIGLSLTVVATILLS